MQKNTDPALNALEEQKKITEQKHISSQPEQNTWTAKAKKNAVYIFEKDGKKTSMPAQAYIRQEAMKLPPMQRNGRRIVHFDEMWWRFMHGATKEESMKAVSDYFKQMVEIWNKAVEEQQAKAAKSKEDESN